jgi:hypothetical protein
MKLFSLVTLGLLLVAATPQVSRTQDQTIKTEMRSVALTNQDVVVMATSKFDDATIQKVIESREVNFDLSVAALVKLKEAGVSQGVIQSMLDKDALGANELDVAANSNPSDAMAAMAAASLSREELAKQLEPGAYYWSEGAWLPLQQLSSSGGGTKHAAASAVIGLTPQMVVTFRDAKAPVQLHESQPLFCVKFYDVPVGAPFTPAVRDLAIARFDQKSDHRELQVTSGWNLFNFKAGLPGDRLAGVNVNSLDETTALITPTAPLRAGEYLISGDPAGTVGFDFGYHPDR